MSWCAKSDDISNGFAFSESTSIAFNVIGFEKAYTISMDTVGAPKSSDVTITPAFSPIFARSVPNKKPRNNQGAGVARINNLVVFVAKALLGEVVRIRLTEIKLSPYSNSTNCVQLLPDKVIVFLMTIN